MNNTPQSFLDLTVKGSLFLLCLTEWKRNTMDWTEWGKRDSFSFVKTQQQQRGKRAKERSGMKREACTSLTFFSSFPSSFVLFHHSSLFLSSFPPITMEWNEAWIGGKEKETKNVVKGVVCVGWRKKNGAHSFHFFARFFSLQPPHNTPQNNPGQSRVLRSFSLFFFCLLCCNESTNQKGKEKRGKEPKNWMKEAKRAKKNERRAFHLPFHFSLFFSFFSFSLSTSWSGSFPSFSFN